MHTADVNNLNLTMADVKYYVPTAHKPKPWIQPKSWSLWSIIRGFKIGITKYTKSWIDIPYWDTFARQARYHDRIIRNQQEYAPQEVPLGYERIKYYIQTNPQNWESDSFNQ